VKIQHKILYTNKKHTKHNQLLHIHQNQELGLIAAALHGVFDELYDLENLLDS